VTAPALLAACKAVKGVLCVGAFYGRDMEAESRAWLACCNAIAKAAGQGSSIPA
jgi:hypothetical protein